jgi:uncharacterized membrane protein
MKTLATALFVALAFVAGVIEVKKNPERYTPFYSLGPR